MSNGLAYFKEVYDTVPGWVQKMQDYNPKMLDTYTAIRGEAFSEGALSRKEKDVLIASMNAARLYPRSMVYHTKGAIDHGLTISELAEYFLVAYLYNGTASLRTSLEAFSYALQLKGTAVEQPQKDLETIEEVIQTIVKWMGDEDTRFIEETLECIKSGNKKEIQEKILGEGRVSTRLKHINMVGNFIIELKGKDAVPWIEKAREAGVLETDLADLGFICILTAGIPTWFELSDSLKLTNQ
ncbi:carboxymuconolactone decarboxylase family protein [Peribacillus sp. TH24]|uniref:carboxymuconolactone decarboxylase family protein n=1 Tax=Peribacillus sp. TH24 TaxID=2798483 RepID=UPI001912B765|nr:carboxymuconolactone decarboxylase family protein [Peribacillus sp. TH24]MBK5446931.1 carboxymuconolactone decarboxylase family protein [Peribacillus sp. TH24]